MRFSLITIATSLLACGPVAAENSATITPDAVRAHVEFLASDALEGRETGTRGYDVAAEYVAARYRAIGLKPAGEKGWFQHVPFAAALVDLDKSRLSVAGQSFIPRKDVLFGPATKPGIDVRQGDVVFVGYGIDDQANGQNDYRGLDVKGKIVAVLQGFPKGMPSDVGAHYSRNKAMMADKRGARGIVTIRTLERERTRPWTREIDGPQHPSMNWTNPDGSMFDEAPGIAFGATLHDHVAEALFAGASVPLKSVLAVADKKAGRPKGFALKQRIKLDRVTTASTVSSPNVIGVLLGSDSELAREIVLLTAHLDHNGIDTTKKGDQVYNGAMDNATGIGAMLEAARALAAGPRLRRTVMFVAVTAEERGLLGADYLARHPVGSGKIVSVVNLDMPVLLYDFKDVIAFGAEHSTMGPAVARAAAKLGLSLSPDPLPSEGLFTRSDHYRFVQQGVPAVFLMTGFKNGGNVHFQEFLKTHYHKVTDDLSRPIDWDSAAKFAQVNTLIAAEIANADEAPKWYADSFFGKAFAPDAAKAGRPASK